jgi:hypothetical protein
MPAAHTTAATHACWLAFEAMYSGMRCQPTSIKRGARNKPCPSMCCMQIAKAQMQGHGPTHSCADMLSRSLCTWSPRHEESRFTRMDRQGRRSSREFSTSSAGHQRQHPLRVRSLAKFTLCLINSLECCFSSFMTHIYDSRVAKQTTITFLKLKLILRGFRAKLVTAL